MESSTPSRALWTPTLPAKVSGSTSTPFGTATPANPWTSTSTDLWMSPTPEAAAAPAGPLSGPPAGPARTLHFGADEGSQDVGTSPASPGPIASAALGASAAPAASAAAAAVYGAPSPSSAAPPSTPDPMQALLREVMVCDEDAAAASDAFQEDDALIHPDHAAKRTSHPPPAKAAAAAAAAGELASMYGTDTYRGYKTMGVTDVDDTCPAGGPGGAGGVGGDDVNVYDRCAAASYGIGQDQHRYGAAEGQGSADVSGGTVAAGGSELGTPAGAFSGVPSSVYSWMGSLEEPLLPQPGPAADRAAAAEATRAVSPGRVGVVGGERLSYTPGGSRRVTFADHPTTHGAAPPPVAARMAPATRGGRAEVRGSGRGGWRLGAPAAARLAVLLLGAAAVSGWWTSECLRHRKLVAWAVLWGLLTASAASVGAYLALAAATASGEALNFSYKAASGNNNNGYSAVAGDAWDGVRRERGAAGSVNGHTAVRGAGQGGGHGRGGGGLEC